MNIESLIEQHISRNKRRADTALAAEGCLLLVELLDRYQPKRIADLGSGLSSTLFRAWAAKQKRPPYVASTDLSVRWLETTRQELVADDRIHASECFEHDPWASEHEAEFDFVFVDLGSTAERVHRAKAIMRLAARPAVVVFDDWQMEHYRTPMSAELKRLGYPIPRRMGKADRFGRYMAVLKLA